MRAMPPPAHDFPFDPTYGYSLEQMLALQPPDGPADLESFWRDTYAQTLATPLQLTEEPAASANPAFRVRLLRFNSFGGVRIGGWLIEPIGQSIRRYAIVGHGYYNRPIEDLSYEPGSARLYFGCRGLGVSRQADIPDTTAWHVLHGIESKETYVHRGCVGDTWAAASALLQVHPEAKGRLEYHGDSFGGGIGAVAVAWDERIRFSRMFVPSFGNYPLRLQVPCTGSGEAVRLKAQRDPHVAEVLRYFDSATCATHIKTPVFVGCALFDPAVPPPGQFTLHNAIRSKKELFVFETGHFDLPTTPAERERALAAATRLRDEVLGN
ncbi:MAG: acetylxylan esterase [Tepidisphaeraceae bacterium]